MRSLPSLSSVEAAARLAQYGPNSLREKPLPSNLFLLLSQLKNPLITILLAAAVVTKLLGNSTDSTIILLAVVVNTILGFIQERKAQHSLAAMKKLLVSRVRVRRDDVVQVVDAATLVPGDTVLLSAGDRIPADGKFIEGAGLLVNEAILTGESMPVAKTVERDGTVFMGTTVVAGRATIQVETTGVRTRVGTITETLEETQEEETPLQEELRRLARVLAVVVLSVASIVLAIGIIRGEALDSMLATAVALAVSAVPEGMVVTLTVILAVGMQRILARHAIVRRLIAAETLGSVTVLCVDKTGTLTEGVMRVTAAELLDKPRAIAAAVLANDLADPLETALWEWASNQDHVDPQAMVENEGRITELPFDSNRKYMAVATPSGIWVKGAPEVLLAVSTLSAAARRHWQMKIDRLAHRGLRLIAVAHRLGPPARRFEPPLGTLDFLGVFGITDPLRPEVTTALAACQGAGVSVKVVTGDYRLTAETVLSAMGLPIKDPSREIIEGKELAQLSTEQLARRIAAVKLFCRVTPEQKLTIVQALKRNGEVVAMTGDGVNDALALKTADIGIVVANASDVARETADMVLLDSSFRTIVAAIEEGRVIFGNIRKVVLYLLSDTFTEIILITVSLLLGIPLPLAAAQILWINIISDGLPNLALAVDPKGGDELSKKPQRQKSPLFPPPVKQYILTVSAAKALLAFLLFLISGAGVNNLGLSQTIVFAFVSIGSLAMAFSLRNLQRPILASKPFANRWLVAAVGVGLVLLVAAIYHPGFASVFHTAPLSLVDWLQLTVAVATFLVILEATKRQVAHT